MLFTVHVKHINEKINELIRIFFSIALILVAHYLFPYSKYRLIFFNAGNAFFCSKQGLNNDEIMR